MSDQLRMDFRGGGFLGNRAKDMEMTRKIFRICNTLYKNLYFYLRRPRGESPAPPPLWLDLWACINEVVHFTYVCMYVCIYISAYLHICIYAYMHICISASMHICIYGSSQSIGPIEQYYTCVCEHWRASIEQGSNVVLLVPEGCTSSKLPAKCKPNGAKIK